jgi:peptide/nickel transport system permease protein
LIEVFVSASNASLVNNAVTESSTSGRRDEAKSMLRIAFEQFFEHRMAVISLLTIALFCGVAIFADVIAGALHIDPDSQDILNRFGPWTAQNWIGTDEAGRDVFVRLIYGTRISLLVAFLVAITSSVIGVAVGAIAGYYGGFIDSLLMRVTDSLLALPTIPILIIMASIDHTKIPIIGGMVDIGTVSIIKMVVVLMTFSWMVQARLVRGEILSFKEQEFVLAAQTSGMPSWAIIIKELLPNVMSPVIVSVTLSIGQAILYEAALSYLGLGIQPPTPSWGNMLNNAQEIIYSSPLLAVIPGLLILIVVMSFNFVGDGLQDALDPKARRR